MGKTIFVAGGLYVRIIAVIVVVVSVGTVRRY
jgi:hypothetical protein